MVNPAFMPFFWVSLSYALLLLGFAFCPIPLLVNRVTRFLGEISYSVYLLHGIVIIFTNRRIISPIYALEIPTAAKFGLCLAITLTITVFLSWLTHRFIEGPGIALSRKLIAARGQRARLAAQPG